MRNAKALFVLSSNICYELQIGKENHIQHRMIKTQLDYLLFMISHPPSSCFV